MICDVIRVWQVGADLESVRFLFDGQRLRPDQTPADVSTLTQHETTLTYCANIVTASLVAGYMSALRLGRVVQRVRVRSRAGLLRVCAFIACFQLDMEDEDEIDAMVQQTGGSQ